MKNSNASIIRARVIAQLREGFGNNDEDVGLIASNVFNFPVVADDGEEGWVEIVVKVPKGTKDEEYDGYARREQYRIDCEEKAARKAEREVEKAKKIERDKARREKKKEGN